MDLMALEKIVLKTQAVQEVEKLMNKYEFLLSHARLEEIMDLFALKMDDVRMEISFGKWVGPQGIERCVMGLHGKLFRGADGLPAVGCFHLNANTTAIIEVADDLKTAKGMWTWSRRLQQSIQRNRKRRDLNGRRLSADLRFYL